MHTYGAGFAGYYIVGIDVAETPDPSQAAHPNIGTALTPEVLTFMDKHVSVEPHKKAVKAKARVKARKSKRGR